MNKKYSAKSLLGTPFSVIPLTDILPIDLLNPLVKEIKIRYTINCVLKRLKKQSQGFLIVTDIDNGEDVPNFIVTKDTMIVFNKPNEQTPATITDLKKGQKLSLNVEYDLKKKVWLTIRVRILIMKDV